MGFKLNEKLTRLQATEQRMSQAKTQMFNACQTILDVNNNWEAYKAADSAENIVVNSLQFSADAKAMTAELVGPLAIALDIIAGGSLSIDGDINSPVLTRQDLLDQLAAYVA